MKTYHIKKGRTAFRPMASLFPALVYSGFSFTAEFDSSCWFSAAEVGGDKDRADWLKLTGITAAFSLNNQRSALIAWRPTDVPDTFAITAYTNNKLGGWKIGGPGFKIATVKAGEQFSGRVLFWHDPITLRPTVDYYIHTPSGTFTATHDFDKPWHCLYREIGPWWGGANDQPGGYGGTAPKDATLQLDFRWEK